MIHRIFSHRWFNPAFMLVTAALVLLAYSNSFTASFQFDDAPIILDNQQLRDLANLPSIIQNTRGLTLATFALNYAAGGTNVVGYHIVNIAIHIINSILVYLLLFHTFMLVKGDAVSAKRLSAFTALIFALHPIQTQSVTYIVQRMESLASLFYVLAILLLVKASSAPSPLKRGLLYGGVGLSYLFAFYSKEIAYTLPAIAVLYDFCFIAKGRPKEIVERWPVYAMLALLFAVFTVTTIMPLGGFGDLSDESAAQEKFAAPKVKGGIAPGPKEYDHSAGFNVTYITPKEYLYSQFNVLPYYMALLLVPVNQNLDYDFPRGMELLTAPVPAKETVLNIPMMPPIVGLVFLSAVIAVAVFFLIRTQKSPSSHKRIVAFFIFWFFIILSPTSSVVPIIDLIYEHRLYLPSLGFFVILVLAIDSLAGLVMKEKARVPAE